MSITKREDSSAFSSGEKGSNEKTKIYNKNKDVPDATQTNWFEFLPFGVVPDRRAYHSTVVIGNNMYVYGGEDLREKIFDNMWILNLSLIERNLNPRFSVEFPTEEDRIKSIA